MNPDQQRVLNAVYAALDELNLTLPPPKQVAKDPQTKLTGSSGSLDSLGLVNLIVETETKIEETFDVSINLADERAVQAGTNPLATIESLVEYIAARLQEEAS